MKKNVLFIAAFCAAALVSCTPKELVIEEPETIDNPKETTELIHITIKASMSESTKATISTDRTWTWEESDKLAVFDGTTVTKEFGIKDILSDGQAIFEGDVASTEGLKAVFPYSAALSDGSYKLSSSQTISTGQTVDPAAMVATATGEKASGNDFTFYFTPAVSFFKLTVGAGVDRVVLHCVKKEDTIAGDSRSLSVSVPGEGTYWVPINALSYTGIRAFVHSSDGWTLKAADSATIDLSKPGSGKNLGTVSGGTNTVAVIENANDYISFATAFNGGQYATDIPVFVLGDLDFSGKSFKTVDNTTYKYGGTWNGNGYLMKNITATNVAMFYTPAGAILNDIIFDESCQFTKNANGTGHWGIIARTLEPGGEMNGCVVNCNWNFEYVASSNVGYGALVGRTTGKLTGCKMTGDIIYTRTRTEKETQAAYIGGLVGYLNTADSYTGSMTGCEMKGNVIFNCPDETLCPTAETTNMFFQVGGVVGYSKGTVENCDMNGDIEYYDHTWNTFLGGVVGNQEGSSYVRNCNMYGNLVAKQQYATASYERLFVGGVVGRAAASSQIENCSNSSGKTISVGSKTNNLVVGGVIGSVLGSATISSCVNNMTIKQSEYGSKMMYIGGVNGVISAGSISDVKNNGPITVDQFSSESGGTVRVGGVIGSCAVNLDGGTITSNKSGIHNTAQVYTHADETSIGYSHANFGGVVGVMSGNAANLTNAGKVYINFGDNTDDSNLMKYVAAGGIIGRLSAAKTVNGCINTAEVQFRYWGTTAKDDRIEYIGGIVGCVMTGQHGGGIAASLLNCSCSGRINESVNNASYISGDFTKGKCVGGIVGAIIGTADSRATINGCICNSTTQHSSSAGYFGGIAGSADYVDITSCTTTVNIQAKRIGGIAAMPRNSTISGCYVQDCTLKNFDQCGGIANASNNNGLIIKDNFVKNVSFESQGNIAAANFGAIARNPVAATTIEHNGISGSYKNNGTTTAFSSAYAPYTGNGTFTCTAGQENYILD